VLQVSWLRGHRHHRAAAAGRRDYRHSALLLLLQVVMEQATGGTRSSVVQLSLERRCRGRCRVRRLDGLVVVARVLLVHRRATSLGH